MCIRSIAYALLLGTMSGAVAAKGQREFLEYGDALLGQIIASMIPEEHRGGTYQGGWKHAFSNLVQGEYAIDEFVPESESIEAWSRLFTHQNLRRSRSSADSPGIMMTGLKKAMQSRCPEVTWSVIRETRSDIVYEFYFADCAGHPDQHEIARIVYGKWNIWRLAYTEKGPRLDQAARARWVEALSEPRVVRQ